MTVSTAHLLATIWGEQEGYIFRPRKTPSGWIEGFARTWPQPEEVLRIGQGNEADLYFCPLVFSAPQRLAQYALPTRVLWSDLDLADPRKISLRPTASWQTTGGVFSDATPHYHAIWLLDRLIPAREAARLSRRIAYGETGADRGGWDVTQVLRIPGTLNHKHSPPHPVRLLWARRLFYTPEQVMATYAEPAVPQESRPADWPDVPPEQVTAVIDALPYGLRSMLVMDPSRVDRSLQLSRVARYLLHFTTPEIAVHVLQRASINKFANRPTERDMLLNEITKAQAHRGS